MSLRNMVIPSLLTGLHLQPHNTNLKWGFLMAKSN
jgi:hypothetical protein